MKQRLDTVRRFVKLQEQLRRLELAALIEHDDRLADLRRKHLSIVEALAADGPLASILQQAASRRLQSTEKQLEEAGKEREAQSEVVKAVTMRMRGGERLEERLSDQVERHEARRDLNSVIEAAVGRLPARSRQGK
jgi:Fic family protein